MPWWCQPGTHVIRLTQVLEVDVIDKEIANGAIFGGTLTRPGQQDQQEIPGVAGYFDCNTVSPACDGDVVDLANPILNFPGVPHPTEGGAGVPCCAPHHQTQAVSPALAASSASLIHHPPPAKNLTSNTTHRNTIP